MEHLWSFLALVGAILLALIVNSYLGLSTWLKTATTPATTV